jgi:hypothetical protein
MVTLLTWSVNYFNRKGFETGEVLETSDELRRTPGNVWGDKRWMWQWTWTVIYTMNRKWGNTFV